MVKADAYGHGAIPVSLRLEKLGVEYLGVAIPEEGVELRKGGVKAPILVLGGVYGGDVAEIFRFHLTPVVFKKDSLETPFPRSREAKEESKGSPQGGYGNGKAGCPFQPLARFFKRGKTIR